MGIILLEFSNQSTVFISFDTILQVFGYFVSIFVPTVKLISFKRKSTYQRISSEYSLSSSPSKTLLFLFCLNINITLILLRRFSRQIVRCENLFIFGCVPKRVLGCSRFPFCVFQVFFFVSRKSRGQHSSLLNRNIEVVHNSRNPVLYGFFLYSITYRSVSGCNNLHSIISTCRDISKFFSVTVETVKEHIVFHFHRFIIDNLSDQGIFFIDMDIHRTIDSNNSVFGRREFRFCSRFIIIFDIHNVFPNFFDIIGKLFNRNLCLFSF